MESITNRTPAYEFNLYTTHMMWLGKDAPKMARMASQTWFVPDSLKFIPTETSVVDHDYTVQIMNIQQGNAASLYRARILGTYQTEHVDWFRADIELMCDSLYFPMKPIIFYNDVTDFDTGFARWEENRQYGHGSEWRKEAPGPTWILGIRRVQ